MTEKVVEIRPGIAADPPVERDAQEAIQSLLSTVEEQAKGIRLLVDLVVQLDARIRKLELAENKRQRKLSIIKPD